MRKKNPLASHEAIKNMTGRVIKYPTIFKEHTIASGSKISTKPMKFIAQDIESDFETGQMHLLGCYDGERYWCYEDNFLSGLTQIIEDCDKHGISLAYWSKFDPTQMFRLMVEQLPPDKQKYALKAWQKISPNWSKETQSFDIPPIAENKIRDRYVGISNAIRSNIQFYVRKEGSKYLSRTWSFNIAPFFNGSIEKASKRYFDWYSKMTKDFPNFSWRRPDLNDPHKLDATDWSHFHEPKTDEDRLFRELVIQSNKLDAMACYHLAIVANKEFADTFFGFYPKAMFSTGQWTRAAIQAIIEHKYKDIPKESRKRIVKDELQSIAIKFHENAWHEQLGDDFNDFYSLCHEVYAGAKIDCYAYGYYEKAYYADISSAYQKTQKELRDLRKSVAIKGEGVPPKPTADEYIIIRGDVEIPGDCDYHPLLIRNPLHEEGNISPVGDFRTAYWYQERELCERMGIRFSNETWYMIRTEGKLSPLADVSTALVDMRYEKIRAKDPDQKRIKDASSGIYGITFQGTESYTIDGEKIVFDGLLGGEYFNPIYASLTTMETRCLITEACLSIRQHGGRPLFAQTDSLVWDGRITDLDEKYWREEKTVGFFEKPEEVHDVISLGAGRYQYWKKDNDPTSETFGEFADYSGKTRGIWLDEIIGEDGIVLKDVSWSEAVKNIIKEKWIGDKLVQDKIFVNVNVLVTPGMVLSNHAYSVKDLGRIVEVTKYVDPISGRNKRKIPQIKNLKDLAKKHWWSDPIPVSGGLILGQEIIDDTLPNLRKELLKMPYQGKKVVRRMTTDESRRDNRDKYWLMRNYGFSVKEAEQYKHKPWDEVLDKVYGSDKMGEDCIAVRRLDYSK